MMAEIPRQQVRQQREHHRQQHRQQHQFQSQRFTEPRCGSDRSEDLTSERSSAKSHQHDVQGPSLVKGRRIQRPRKRHGATAQKVQTLMWLKADK
jgi:hypothetical protein